MGCFPKDGDFGLTHAQADAVKDVFGAIARKKAAVMRQEMRESAHALGERRTLKFADGNGGAVEMMVHPVSYHYWGNRLGYGCWQDAEFCREYLRDNEEARVRSRPDELTVVVRGAGGLAASGKKRFHKVYGAGGEMGGMGSRGSMPESQISNRRFQNGSDTLKREPQTHGVGAKDRIVISEACLV